MNTSLKRYIIPILLTLVVISGCVSAPEGQEPTALKKWTGGLIGGYKEAERSQENEFKYYNLFGAPLAVIGLLIFITSGGDNKLGIGFLGSGIGASLIGIVLKQLDRALSMMIGYAVFGVVVLGTLWGIAYLFKIWTGYKRRMADDNA